MRKPWWQTSKANTALFSFVAATVLITAISIGLYSASRSTGKTGATLSNTTPSGKTLTNLGPVYIPERLIIPKIAVDANVQSVGLAASGRIGIPSNFVDVAWYNMGPLPGEPGSAIIDGHLDTARDAKAVFARLHELNVGDEIDVIDKTGQKIKFRVTATEIYDEANAPLSKIFDPTKASSRLNLITCDGAWDQKTRNYNKRLVVYSERVI